MYFICHFFISHEIFTEFWRKWPTFQNIMIHKTVAVRSLGSLVRIQLEAWMYLLVFLRCFPVQARWTDPPSKESYQMSKKVRKSGRRGAMAPNGLYCLHLKFSFLLCFNMFIILNNKITVYNFSCTSMFRNYFIGCFVRSKQQKFNTYVYCRA